ncbi:MAG: L17 family ribosomal protein, partial [Planctomycetota bacterium]
MRHRVAGKKLGRNTSHRKALMRSLVRSLINEFDGKGYIVTTREKAKYAQPRVEKLITLGKNKSIANVRKA